MILRTMIISPDAALVGELQEALARFKSHVAVTRTLTCYPQTDELSSVLRAHAPGAVFLSFENSTEATRVARTLAAEAPGIQILALHPTSDPELLRHSMRAGIREFLTPPFGDTLITHSLGHVLQTLEHSPVRHRETDEVLAFLPCKAGVGATSLALKISTAMALASEDNRRVLLGDLDLNSGALRFLLNLTNSKTVLDAVQHIDELDERTWPDYVTPFGKLDVMHPGPVNPSLRLDAELVATLIQFVRRNYQSVCFDLSGNLERYSLGIMQEVKHVVLVCTPEVPSMHLAREKIAFLSALGIEKKVLVVMNRMTFKAPIPKREAEQILGVKVFGMFSEDREAFETAEDRGTSLDLQSRLGQECMTFIDALPRGGSTKGRSGQSKFLEFFALTKS